MPSPKNYKQFHTYFYPGEWKRITEKSAKAKLKPTTYIKRVALFGEIKVYDTSNVENLMLAINRYGNAVNQIARMANTTNSVYRNDIEEIQADVRKIKTDIVRYLSEVEYDLI